MVGGDFNNKNMSTLTSALPELKPIRAGVTRGDEALDEIYCNIDRCITQKEILHPLCKDDGTESDHLIIAAAANLPRFAREKPSTFKFRPLTRKGTEKFKGLLLGTDWNTVKKGTSSESTVALTELLNGYICECFPEKTRKAKKNDAPWFNSKTRRAVNKKMRIYKREGKSENYKKASKECEN